MTGRFAADPGRLAENLKRLTHLGRSSPSTAGLLALTKEEVAARLCVIDLMGDVGLTVEVDPLGNVLGRREGVGPASLATVAAGSSLGSPAARGTFGGVVGVLAAIEALRMIQIQGIQTEHPIAAVATAGKPFDRFGMTCLGGRAIAGTVSERELLELGDGTGTTLWQALEEVGLHPERLQDARLSRSALKCFLELDLEQGRRLEASGRRIGIVTAIAAATRVRVTVTGVADPHGATPTVPRREALSAACELILALEGFANADADCGSVGTVGVLHDEPGAARTGPEKVEFQVEIQAIDRASMRRLTERFRNQVAALPQWRSVRVTREVSMDQEPFAYTKSIVTVLRETCDELGVEALLMPSGTGHDSQHVGGVTDVGMLVIPSPGAISNPSEQHPRIDDLCRGSEVLAESLVRLAAEREVGRRSAM